MSMREFSITIYLLSFKLLFNLFKHFFSLKNKITFVVSFYENPMFIYEKMKHINVDVECVFLCHPRCCKNFTKTGELVYLFESKNIWHTLKGIYHLATSRVVMIDNYYGFLSVIEFKKEVECIQIWHAVGAVKKFGIEDPSNNLRSPQVIDRFKKVYRKFDKIVVGSEFMSSIFQKVFLASEDKFLKIGIPRTDFFFQTQKHEKIKQTLFQTNPALANKKVILYAPTFRKDETSNFKLQLDINKMHKTLKDEYALILKLHPSVDGFRSLSDKYSGFVFDYSDYKQVNDLLIITDILITDYSSIPMEFAFLRRKMIFYAYDLHQYKKTNGIWEDYGKNMPGPISKTTDELITEILNPHINLHKIDAFKEKWTAYCEGDASEKFVEYLLQNLISH